MESLDFTQPVPKPPPAATGGARPAPASTYDPAIATAFFREAGAEESAAAGKVFFRERDHKGLFSGDDRMYLLLEGSIGLTIEGKPIDTVKAGEIFGEMTSITNGRRSATATAKSDCRVIALDGGQFRKAIERKPEFVLVLMSLLVDRFRLTLARLAIKKVKPQGAAQEERAVFDESALESIAAALDHPAPLRYNANQTIVNVGDPGVFMYFPIEGRVAIVSDERVLQSVGVGSVFGEMALIDSAPRAAKVVAQTDCALLAVNRAQFLQLAKSMPEVGLGLLRVLAQRFQGTMAQFSR